MNKKHNWQVMRINGVMCKQVCSVCGALRFAKPGGWGRAMAPDFKSARRFCNVLQ